MRDTAAGDIPESARGADARPTRPDAVLTMLEGWRRERPDVDPWPLEVFGYAGELERLWRSAMTPVFQRHDLKGGDYELLSHVRREGPPYEMSPTELSQRLYITTGAVTRRLDRLTDKGLLVRRPHDTDRRALMVQLTEFGVTVTDAVMEAVVARSLQIVAPLRDRLDEVSELARPIVALLLDAQP